MPNIVFSAHVSLVIDSPEGADGFIDALEELLSEHSVGEEYELQDMDYWEVEDAEG